MAFLLFKRATFSVLVPPDLTRAKILGAKGEIVSLCVSPLDLIGRIATMKIMAKTKSAIAVELGRRGGSKTLKKYGKKQLLIWAKRGAEARRKAVDKSPL